MVKFEGKIGTLYQILTSLLQPFLMRKTLFKKFTMFTMLKKTALFLHDGFPNN